MSDLDKFISLYKEIGVLPEISKDKDFTFLILEPATQEKVGGDGLSYTQIRFDLHGKFISQEFYQLGDDY